MSRAVGGNTFSVDQNLSISKGDSKSTSILDCYAHTRRPIDANVKVIALRRELATKAPL